MQVHKPYRVDELDMEKSPVTNGPSSLYMR